MKSLQDFKQIVEEEKQDFSKFDALVRAGLANKSQITRLHKILGKMSEDRPTFSPQDRQIMQDLFNKMLDLVTNNKQINTVARRAVREETLEEGIIDTADIKPAGYGGPKVRAHRIKVGDDAPQVSDDPDEVKKESVEINEAVGDPPFVLVLKRKAIRLYPDGTKIALYYNDRLGKSFSIPYGPSINAVIQAEETQIEEAVDPVKHLQKIKDTHQMATVNHKDGSASKIDVQTAHALLMVHKSLNGENQKKFSDMMARSNHHMKKAADFAWKHVK